MSALGNIRHVARIEFSEERNLPYLLAACVLLALGIIIQSVGAFLRYGAGTADISPEQYYATIRLTVRVLGPFLAILLSYRSLAAEGRSGTLRLLLSAPYEREQVLLGKYVGQLSIAVVPFGAALIVAGVCAAYLSVFEILPALNFAVLSLWLAAAFVSVSVYFSASFLTSPTKALLNGVGVVALSLYAWPTFVRLLVLTLLPDGFDTTLFTLLVPTGAYSYLTGTEAGSGALTSVPSLIALGALFLWTVIPLLVAVFRFRRRDV